MADQDLHNLRLEDDGDEGNGEPPTESLPSLDEVEKIIGYRFKNRSLLEQAFTHHSYDLREECPTYERLEYVGDSVLNLVIAKEQFFLYPHLAPGQLTRLRAANVDTEKLARVAVKHNLHKYLRHRKPLLEQQIAAFMEAIMEYPLHSSGLVDAPKVLADVVESTIGAIFIDSNSSIDTTWKVLKDLLQPMITPKTLHVHPVTKLHELCQKHGFRVAIVDKWKDTGEIEFFVDNELAGKEQYVSKKTIAAHRAANSAYNWILKKLSAENELWI